MHALGGIIHEMLSMRSFFILSSFALYFICHKRVHFASHSWLRFYLTSIVCAYARPRAITRFGNILIGNKTWSVFESGQKNRRRSFLISILSLLLWLVQWTTYTSHWWFLINHFDATVITFWGINRMCCVCVFKRSFLRIWNFRTGWDRDHMFWRLRFYYEPARKFRGGRLEKSNSI